MFCACAEGVRPSAEHYHDPTDCAIKRTCMEPSIKVLIRACRKESRSCRRMRASGISPWKRQETAHALSWMWRWGAFWTHPSSRLTCSPHMSACSSRCAPRSVTAVFEQPVEIDCRASESWRQEWHALEASELALTLRTPYDVFILRHCKAWIDCPGIIIGCYINKIYCTMSRWCKMLANM